MKKYLTITVLGVLSIALISWGVVGHKTVATIAENHLTSKSKEMVKALLGNESLADVASWADQVLKEPEYKNTAPEHYLNVQLDLSYADFQKEVLAQTRDNVYKALLKNEEVLKSQTSTKEQKTVALKFIVHFVGIYISRCTCPGQKIKAATQFRFSLMVREPTYILCGIVS